jgi:hypothetical protein
VVGDARAKVEGQQINNTPSNRREHFMSRVSGTGQYGNYIVPRENPDDVPELTAAQVKQAYEQAVQADSKLTARRKGSDAFAATHPEYLDTEANGQAMGRTLNALFGDVAYSEEMFDTAYNVLRANNGLELDQAEIVKQQQAEANQRAKVERAKRAAQARVYTENELESMSLEELRNASNRQLQKEQRVVGERGGFDIG